MRTDVTQLLLQWSEGDREAFDRLIPVVYDDLKRLAHARLNKESPAKRMNTTGLVHESYLRLVDITRVRWKDRAHFLAMASRTMRRVLIDQARHQNAQKRGGDAAEVAYRDDLYIANDHAETLLELDDALQQLESAHPRRAKALELRYFGGLTLEETANVLDVSAPTVMRDVRFAEAWIARAWNGRPGT